MFQIVLTPIDIPYNIPKPKKAFDINIRGQHICFNEDCLIYKKDDKDYDKLGNFHQLYIYCAVIILT
jgi:hypothetical protein